MDHARLRAAAAPELAPRDDARDARLGHMVVRPARAALRAGARDPARAALLDLDRGRSVRARDRGPDAARAARVGPVRARPALREREPAPRPVARGRAGRAPRGGRTPAPLHGVAGSRAAARSIHVPVTAVATVMASTRNAHTRCRGRQVWSRIVSTPVTSGAR